ncbi:MAG: hypothetical protein ACQEXN_15655 [Actinomycetota bacterium]
MTTHDQTAPETQQKPKSYLEWKFSSGAKVFRDVLGIAFIFLFITLFNVAGNGFWMNLGGAILIGLALDVVEYQHEVHRRPAGRKTVVLWQVLAALAVTILYISLIQLAR